MNKVIFIVIALVSAQSMAQVLVSASKTSGQSITEDIPMDELAKNSYPGHEIVCNTSAKSASLEFTHAIYQAQTSIVVPLAFVPHADLKFFSGKSSLKKSYKNSSGLSDEAAVFQYEFQKATFGNLHQSLRYEVAGLINDDSSKLFGNNGSTPLTPEQTKALRAAVRAHGAIVSPAQSSACVDIQVIDPFDNYTPQLRNKLVAGSASVTEKIDEIRERSVKVNPDGRGFVNGYDDQMVAVGKSK